MGEEEIKNGKTEFHLKLIERFGEHRVSACGVTSDGIPLLLLDLDPINGKSGQVTVLVTNGLSNYVMPVPEKLEGKEHVELYFCLPSYWEWENTANSSMNWVFYWIQRLANYVQEKNSWFGHGHTMPCGKDMESLSPTMQQNHFFLSDPMLLEEELCPLVLSTKTVNFLSIIPIFPDEMDYKQGKGTLKLVRKLTQHGVTEKLDDYRGTVLRSKWRMFKR